MKSNKKVFLLGPAHPFRGGIADTQNQLAQNLKLLGYQVFVYTFTKQYPNFFFPGKTQFSDEQPPNAIKIERKIHSYKPTNWNKVAQTINAEKPDTVIFRYWSPVLAPCWAGIARNLDKEIKKIGLIDNWKPHEKKPWDSLLTRIFYKQMNGFATLSFAVGLQIESTLPNSPVWKGFHPIADNLPPAIPQEKARKILGWPENKKIVLFFGLVRKYKGLDLLITAFSKPPLYKSDVVLAIVGEAYESEKKYTEMIESLALKDRVLLDFNYATTEKARIVFSAADLVAQTYRNATQSGVTPLAYHFQVPLLVSDIPGLKTPVLEDSTGEICKIDPLEIAERLSFMFSGDVLTQCKSAFLKVKNKYHWRTFGKSLMAFINQI